MKIIKNICLSCKNEIEFPDNFKIINCPSCGVILEIKHNKGVYSFEAIPEYGITPVIIETYKSIFHLKLVKEDNSHSGDDTSDDTFFLKKEIISPHLDDSSDIAPEEIDEDRTLPVQLNSGKAFMSFEPSSQESQEDTDEDETITLSVKKEMLSPLPEINLPEISKIASRENEEEKTVILDVIKKEGKTIIQDDIKKDEGLPPESSKNGNKISVFMYLLPTCIVLIVIFFAVFYKIKNKDNTVNLTPTVAMTVKPVIEETIIQPSSTKIPEAEITKKPTEVKHKPTLVPTEVIAVIEYPTEVPTEISYVAVPTNPPIIVPTRPVYRPNPQPVYIVKPTPVPQNNYQNEKRIYCDDIIRNKVIPLYTQQRYEEAITECNYLLSKDRNYYLNYIWMAQCYLARKDTADAKYYIDMAWRLEYNEKKISYEQSDSKRVFDLYRSLGGK